MALSGGVDADALPAAVHAVGHGHFQPHQADADILGPQAFLRQLGVAGMGLQGHLPAQLLGGIAAIQPMPHRQQPLGIQGSALQKGKMLPPQPGFFHQTHIRRLAPGISGEDQHRAPADGLPGPVTGPQIALPCDHSQLQRLPRREIFCEALRCVLTQHRPGKLAHHGIGQPQHILLLPQIEAQPPQHAPAHQPGGSILRPKSILIPMPDVL